MNDENSPIEPTDVLLVAVPETAGSALYGMLDVLSATGSVWETLTREGATRQCFRVRIVSPLDRPFTCGHGIPVTPDCCTTDDPSADVVILPELWLGPDESMDGRYPELVDWILQRHAAGASIYSACSGAILLAATGLLDGSPATSHWGYRDLFREQYPDVKFDPAPNLCYADKAGRVVTAGGVTSWHDLALHIIARYASPADALNIAKVYLLKWHSEGDLPYANLVRKLPHNDSVAKRCENWLTEHFQDPDAVARAVEQGGIPERSLKRRFKAATGCSLMDYLQNLRVEESKRLLETTSKPIDEISESVGYSDSSFFRRLFKRLTGLTPSRYRRMFQPILANKS